MWGYSNFLRHQIFVQKRFWVLIWLLAAAVVSVVKYCSVFRNNFAFNNYRIFKYSFWNLWEEKNLYACCPDKFFDSNHYGPFFSVVIAPFAICPDWLGLLLWNAFNAFILLWAIWKLPLTDTQKSLVSLVMLNSMIVAATNTQSNSMVAALIILSLVYVIRGNDFWGTLMIAAGAMIKLYGIVGIVFFLFSKKKKQFVISLAVWFVVLFALPMVFAGPDFVVQSYADWYQSLTVKNSLNNDVVSTPLMQNTSVIGFFIKTFHLEVSNLVFVIPAAIICGLPFLRFDRFKSTSFQLLMLCSMLLVTVLFSTGTEPNTYVIGMSAVAIWLVIQPSPLSKLSLWLFIFALVITGFGPSDLFPSFIYNAFVKPYALMALPCFLIWLAILREASLSNLDCYRCTSLH